MIEAAKDLLDKPYDSVTADTSTWVIVARGAFGFRYGPYQPSEAGKILSQCVDEGIPAFISMECGNSFDWELARDMRGWPQDWLPMADAPTDGQEIIGDVNGCEVPMVWWITWEVWRRVDDAGKVFEPISPSRWRWK